MFIDLFYKLRDSGIPVSITEYLTLLEALEKNAIDINIDAFYYLLRATLVKDERNFDRFDRIFGAHFKGMDDLIEQILAEIPAEWLQRQAQLNLSEEEKRQIEAMGGWEKLMETLRQRLEEQQGQHSGGNKWIGTGGTSPYGAYGYNPEGIRIGQQESRQHSAVKVWDKREYRNLDDTVEIGTRNIKLALRHLRKFAREGATDELDLDKTINATAQNAGLLDIHMIPERHNAVKILLFLDVGGSMDYHVKVCEELFSATRTEFKHLEYFYFHNCVYDSVWRDNKRRHNEQIMVMDVMHKYGHDHKLIFVGDASMSPYEIMMDGGSIEYWNQESGATWMARLLATYPHAIWLNPVAEEHWQYTASIMVIKEIMHNRMFPLTLAGLTRGIEALKHQHIN
ncbi:MAG: VWA domain-containing protein [Proteobacteria bacterium]|nr:VWA domain-containing protein [Pseudomonadota bacterium]